MSYIEPAAEETFFLKQKELLSRIGVQSNPLIVDVGANIGQSIESYTTLFPTCRMISFEPLPNCFETLSSKYGNNSSITLENIALAEDYGTAPFYATQCAPASSLLTPDETVKNRSIKGNYNYSVLQVNTENLDNYCSLKKISEIDILKIDVQGAEIQVLHGAKKLLHANAIKMIYIEVIFANNYNKQCDITSLNSFLGKYGYVLWDIKPFLFTRSGRLWTANALYVSEPSCSTLENYPEEFPIH